MWLFGNTCIKGTSIVLYKYMYNTGELRRLSCMNIVKNRHNSKVMVFKLIVNYYVLVPSGNHYIVKSWRVFRRVMDLKSKISVP